MPLYKHIYTYQQLNISEKKKEKGIKGISSIFVLPSIQQIDKLRFTSVEDVDQFTSWLQKLNTVGATKGFET